MPHHAEVEIEEVFLRPRRRQPRRKLHWLLRHPYGRGLLAAKLAMMRPDLEISQCRIHPALIRLLERTVDELGLRAWPIPVTMRERGRATVLLLRMAWALRWGSAPPDWRARHSVRPRRT